jgi:hypothetical protein
MQTKLLIFWCDTSRLSIHISKQIPGKDCHLPKQNILTFFPHFEDASRDTEITIITVSTKAYTHKFLTFTEHGFWDQVWIIWFGIKNYKSNYTCSQAQARLGGRCRKFYAQGLQN